MKRLVIAIALSLVMAGSVLAQSRSGPTLWGGSLNIGKIQGIEAAPGTMDLEDQICWGRTFSMMDETASLTIAPDYYINLVSGPGEYPSKVTGGSWTLVHRGGKQTGMLFGNVTGGTIEWYYDKAGNPTHGVLELSVNIAGGTGGYGHIGGAHTTGTFRGSVEYSEKFPVVTGSMELLF